jgi:hypothetical protein
LWGFGVFGDGYKPFWGEGRGSVVGEMFNKKFLKSWGKTCQLSSTLPILIIYSFIHHPTLSKPKKRKRKLVSSPQPSPKKEKKGLVPNL